MKKYIIWFVASFFAVSCSDGDKSGEVSSWVNPFIGTDAFGHTYPGALVPWGMVQLSPDTGTEGWNWCSGYHSSDSSIIGFSHTHLSGTGCPDMGDILFMPISGNPLFEPGSRENPDEGYRSRFSKNTEKAHPGYYSVILDDEDVKVELTASERVGLHRYTFGNRSEAGNWIIVDLGHGLEDRTLESRITVFDGNKIQGYRHSTGFIRDQHIYFYAEFSKPVRQTISHIDGETGNTGEMTGGICKAALKFDISPGEEIIVKVALSYVSEEGAMKNLQAEVPHWNFDQVARQAKNAWESKLSKIEISCNDHDQKTIFYTALYHTLISPNLVSDSDGRYRGWDGQIRTNPENFYTNFSLWDTYRAVHPLLGLIFPEMNRRFIGSMLQRYQEIGELPINEYGMNETFSMIGHHSIPVMADALVNSFCEFDTGLAFEAVRHSSTTDQFNFKADWEKYMRYGYLPADSIPAESVSRTLEFAYNDWCVAQMAKILGKTGDYEYFSKRAGFYKNLFDRETSLMRGRNSDGSWVVPFDPFKISHASSGGGDYTEANAWQYTWHVQHDPEGLIGLMGGKERFASKLDSLFILEPKVYGDGLTVDVTGLIGQYVHGNEPCHHVPYLYTYAGMPWKTQEKVREIQNTFYKNLRDGLCGNDDCGQLSAWYIYGALGFYPACPGSESYVIGTPSFTWSRIHLPGGKEFIIQSERVSNESFYIRSSKLNGKNFLKPFINIRDIRQGGKLEFEMGPTPPANP